ncbi:HSP20 family molecular chaperone IbpA [Roseateles terrae]|uniref:HSP20 family molecular chaperone IbpA n=2 Tax=Roseateles terrae TaxID=431060 RepID=A0ABR6GTY7_9BURK|nr:HSP20 family molecular chaperone IbpA [Roseateles terrae]
MNTQAVQASTSANPAVSGQMPAALMEGAASTAVPTTAPVNATPASGTAPASASSTAARPRASTSRQRDDLALVPPVDVIEDAQGITLYADLPGVPRDLLNLRVDGDQLIIEAEMRLDMPEGLRAGHAEVTRQHYRRVFTLSKELDAEQIRAELTQGVLQVRLPKAAHAQPRKIQVALG